MKDWISFTLSALVSFGFVMSWWYIAKLRGQVKRERLCHAGARWLANRNYLLMAATQDWALKRLNVSMREFYSDVVPLLHGSKYVAQVINLAQVPSSLIQAAIEFNKATDQLVGTVFYVRWLDIKQEERIIQLESAVARLTGKNYEDYVTRVAEEAGVTTAEAQLILLTYTSIINDEVEHLLGMLLDPEEILPSIY